MLRSNLGVLDSDEAVIGLMALQVLDGEFSVFFWLQAYTGFAFETDECIIATSAGFVFSQRYDELVRADRAAAYAFVRGSSDDSERRGELTGRGYRVVADRFVVYVRNG